MKNKQHAPATNETPSTIETETEEQKFFPAGMDLVAVSGAMQWVKISDIAKAFTQVDHTDKTKPLDNVVEGELLGKEEMAADADGEIRSYYKIQLSRPCQVETKSDGEKIERLAQPGEIVNLGERQKLSPLDPLLASGNRHHVFIYAAEKIRIGKGKTMWTFTIGKTLIKSDAPLSTPV